MADLVIIADYMDSAAASMRAKELAIRFKECTSVKPNGVNGWGVLVSKKIKDILEIQNTEWVYLCRADIESLAELKKEWDKEWGESEKERNEWWIESRDSGWGQVMEMIREEADEIWDIATDMEESAIETADRDRDREWEESNSEWELKWNTGDESGSEWDEIDSDWDAYDWAAYIDGADER